MVASQPAEPEDVARVLETIGVRQGVDVREWLRCVLPQALSFSVGGADVAPPRTFDSVKNSSSPAVTAKTIDGLAVAEGCVEILRGVIFIEDATSAADSIELGIIGGPSNQDPLFNRLGGPFANTHLIGDDSLFTVGIMSWLPIALYPGSRLRIRLRRALVGELGGAMKEIKEAYTIPWRPVGF